MMYAPLEQYDEAVKAIEMAQERGLPPVLGAPLRWLEARHPDFVRTATNILSDPYADQNR